MNTVQKLVLQYVPLANKLAYQKKKTLPEFIDIDDLRSAAYIGLVEAASRFDDDFGVAFSTFAYPRIFGAIQNCLKELGWDKRVNEDFDIEAKSQSTHEEFLEFVGEKLGEQARYIMKLYFIEDYSMKEVGDKIGITEGRVSQLVKSYRDHFRNNWNRHDLCEILAN